MKYLIIQNAGDNGIWINGSQNTLDHIITRYNGDTGIQLSDNAYSNYLNYCYSYRNIDVPTYGGNADGFAPKLGASKTKFNYCFAWDNLMMVGIHMTKKETIQLLLNIYIQLVGIMVMLMSSLVNMIIIKKLL